MNAKTSAYMRFFSPKIGGDTEGVENLTFCTPPTFCRPAKYGAGRSKPHWFYITSRMESQVVTRRGAI